MTTDLYRVYKNSKTTDFSSGIGSAYHPEHMSSSPVLLWGSCLSYLVLDVCPR